MKKLSKIQLRERMLKQLAALEPQVFQDAGKKAAQILEPYFLESIALFKSLKNEVDTSLLIPNFKSVLLPDQNPEHYAQRILEAKIKHVLIPGLAFDLQGHRLGRGLGYYDRCLAVLRKSAHCPEIIGLCLTQQVLTEIPVDSHDQTVDRLIEL